MRLKSTRIGTLLVLLVLGGFAAGCADLGVENFNEPDIDRVYATPEDVKNIIGGAYLTWWQGSQGYQGYGAMFATGADQATSSWGNFAMREFSSQPRLAWNNNSTASYASSLADPYSRLYAALGTANDVLIQIDGGLEINTPEETQMVQTAAYLMQGLTHATLGLVYDRAFIVDETAPDLTTLEFPADPNYAAVIDAAMSKFDKAIAAAGSMSIAFPSNYVNGYSVESNPLDGEKIGEFASSMAARTLMLSARTPAETASIDWNRVLAYAENGISGWNFAPEGDNDQWWDLTKAYMQRPGWAQADLELLGQDPNLVPALEAWDAIPLESRTPAPFEELMANTQPADARVPGIDGETEDFVWEGTAPFRADRGTYHFSRFRYVRYDHHLAFIGPMPYFTETENDLIIAEALLRTGGDAERAATLINKTRVDRGGLDAVSGADSTDDLLKALMYERRMELGWTMAGIGWMDRRRSDIQGPVHYGNDASQPTIWEHKPGTPRHMPVPGAELEILQRDLYTYGGSASDKRSALLDRAPLLSVDDVRGMLER